MTNESNEKNLKKPAEGAEASAKAPVKKKLSVVFKPQNSSNIKELPKGLKNALHGGKPAKENAAQPQKKGPRPLPAGTKPVKPAVYGEIKEEPVRAAAPQRTQEAQGQSQTAAQSQSTEPRRTFAGDRSGAAGSQRPQTASGAGRPQSGERTERSFSTERRGDRPQQGERSDRPRSFGNADRGPRPAGGFNRTGDGQRRDGQQRPQDGDRRRSFGQRPQEGGQGTGGRPAAGSGMGRGPRPAGGPGTGRPQGGGRPGAGRGAGSAAAPAFDAAKKNTGNRGKNAQKKDVRHDKKDKYRDDFAAAKTQKTGKGAFIKPEPKKEAPEDDIKVITIGDSLTIRELADKLKLQPSVIIKKLFLQGKMVTPNTDLTYEEAEEIAMEYDILCEKEEKVDVIAELLKEDEEDDKDMVPRSPVVCVMGHVDHGKTSLLDAIRNTNVTSHEAGGITQHIGASVVKVGDRKITFLDTPGHEAFTAMRLRGAQATDIAVLVVAADDGVKPQTIEAISHAKAAGVEVVVAINKMDKPGANPDKVKKELAEHELIAEDWGGSTTMVPVSAKKGEGINELLEMILLEADVMELKANPNRKARGLVIEAQLDKGRGPVATVLVQKGTLRVGDSIAAGSCYGKVRAMLDDRGNRVKKAGPSTPVEILGLNDVPNAGEVFMGCDNEKEARSIAETFISEHKQKMVEETKQKMNLNDLFDEIKAGNVKELPIIIKADVQGSVEAVRQSLGKLSNEEVAVKVIHAGVGNINESDVSLASAANAIIIGFNVKPDATAKSIAEHEKVDVRLYKVIYQAIEDLEAALTGMLAPVYEEKTIGRAIVRQIFKASGVGTIAGCYVTDGVIERGAKARITRGDKQLFDGNIASLKRFKDEVKEVKTGYECGMVFEDFGDLAEDDNIEVYKMVEVPRTPKTSSAS